MSFSTPISGANRHNKLLMYEAYKVYPLGKLSHGKMDNFVIFCYKNNKNILNRVYYARKVVPSGGSDPLG